MRIIAARTALELLLELLDQTPSPVCWGTADRGVLPCWVIAKKPLGGHWTCHEKKRFYWKAYILNLEHVNLRQEGKYSLDHLKDFDISFRQVVLSNPNIDSWSFSHSKVTVTFSGIVSFPRILMSLTKAKTLKRTDLVEAGNLHPAKKLIIWIWCIKQILFIHDLYHPIVFHPQKSSSNRRKGEERWNETSLLADERIPKKIPKCMPRARSPYLKNTIMEKPLSRTERCGKNPRWPDQKDLDSFILDLEMKSSFSNFLWYRPTVCKWIKKIISIYILEAIKIHLKIWKPATGDIINPLHRTCKGYIIIATVVEITPNKWNRK